MTGRQSAFRRIVTPFASSRLGGWLYVNVAPYIDRPLMKLTGGRISTGGGGLVGMLRVKGAKSGVERQTPLAYTRDGETILLVASRGGDTKHPGWYWNLLANPEVGFSIEGSERLYEARELEGAERERAWKLVNRTYAGFSTYQKRAERLIPVMALEPR